MLARRHHVLIAFGITALLLINLIPPVPADSPSPTATGTVVVHVAFANFSQFHTVAYIPPLGSSGNGDLTCGTGSTCTNDTLYGNSKFTCGGGSTCFNDTMWNSTVTCNALAACSGAAYGDGSTACPPLVATCGASTSSTSGTQACATACSVVTNATLLCNANATCLTNAARGNGTLICGGFGTCVNNTGTGNGTLSCGLNTTCKSNAVLGTSLVTCADTSTCTGNAADGNVNVTCSLGAVCKGNVALGNSTIQCMSTSICENNHVLGNSTFTCSANAWCVNNTVVGNSSFMCGSGAVCKNNTIVDHAPPSAPAPPAPPAFSQALTIPFLDAENDWIVDGKITVEDSTDASITEYCQAQGRTGHSRFFPSTGIDFTLHFNGTAACATQNYTIRMIVNNHGLDNMEDLCNTQFSLNGYPPGTCTGAYCESAAPGADEAAAAGCEAIIHIGNLSALAVNPMMANFTGFGDGAYGFGYPGEYDAVVNTTTSIAYSDVSNMVVTSNPWLVRLDIKSLQLEYTGGPPANPAGGDDWIIDAKVNATDGSCSSVVRTMQSRFFNSTSVNLLIRNATGCENQTLDLHIVPYLHLWDSYIDVNGNASGVSIGGSVTCDSAAKCSESSAYGDGSIACSALSLCKSEAASGNGVVSCLSGASCENNTANGYAPQSVGVTVGPCPPQVGPNASLELLGQELGSFCDVRTTVTLTDGADSGVLYADGTKDGQADTNDGNLTYEVHVWKSFDSNTTHLAFLLTPDAAPDLGSTLASDWLLDGNATTSNPLCSAQWRTSHSRYFTPRALDLTMYAPAGTSCFSSNVTIQLMPYSHTDDTPVDINRDDATQCPALPAPTDPTKWQGCMLTLTWDPSSPTPWQQKDGADDHQTGEANAKFGWMVTGGSP
jgi:hypothetical protein